MTPQTMAEQQGMSKQKICCIKKHRELISLLKYLRINFILPNKEEI